MAGLGCDQDCLAEKKWLKKDGDGLSWLPFRRQQVASSNPKMRGENFAPGRQHLQNFG
jgi:hypothetical protein